MPKLFSNIISILIFTFLSICYSHIFAAPASFTPLGDLPGGYVESHALAVSNDGSVVVGQSASSNGYMAFRWTEATGMVNLGYLPGTDPSVFTPGYRVSSATDISGDGSIIVGCTLTPGSTWTYSAFYWTELEGMIEIGACTEASTAKNVSISNDGQAITASGDNMTYRWTKLAGLTYINSTPDMTSNSPAAISGDGNIIAGSGSIPGYRVPYRWTATGGMSILGELPAGVNVGNARAMSSDGLIVVGSTYSDQNCLVTGTSCYRAFRWTQNLGMHTIDDPIALLGTVYESWSGAVSSNGAYIVGTKLFYLRWSPFIWDSQYGMRDLQSVAETEQGLDLTNWQMAESDGISEDGSTIVGWGRNQNNDIEAYRLVLDQSIPSLPNARLSLGYQYPTGTLYETLPIQIPFTVTNEFPYPVDSSTFTVSLPSNAQFVSVATSSGQCDFNGLTAVCSLGPLANQGDTITVDVTVAYTTNAYPNQISISVTPDNRLDLWPANATFTSSISHYPPANAGTDQTVNEGSSVLLTAMMLEDTQGHIASYAWTQNSGPAVTLQNASTSIANFVAPEVTTLTQMGFTLAVSYTDGGVSYDSVSIWVNNVNKIPSVDAGLDQIVNENTAVNLMGSASDLDGSIVGYVWTQVSGPVVTLVGATTQNASFTAPEVTADTVLQFQLTVTDNDGGQASDTTNVTVQNVNKLPTADAGANQAVDENTLANLTGSASDLDGSIVGYAWTQVSGPVVTLVGATTQNASFTAPEVTADTVLQFQLTVTDNEGGQASDTTNVTVQNVNKLPMADAGANQAVDENTPATLTASASDPDGSIVSYVWTQVSGPVVALVGATTQNASFTAPEITVDTVLQFQLTVTDNEGGQASDTLDVTVRNVNKLPIADAGIDQTVLKRSQVTLDGTASNDIDGSIVSYQWQQIQGPAVNLSDTTSITPVFTAPNVTNTAILLIFQLTVVDNEGGVAIDQVAINVVKKL